MRKAEPPGAALTGRKGADRKVLTAHACYARQANECHFILTAPSLKKFQQQKAPQLSPAAGPSFRNNRYPLNSSTNKSLSTANSSIERVSPLLLPSMPAVSNACSITDFFSFPSGRE